ncbi:dynactin-associated protein [Marmota flaviventris]|uniref:dynactin-associated protein n=1 Tax=Marmota flaviventris TaxID=93162 RepID=UPI003A842A22
MDRKQGKYVVNVELSGNQPPSTCPNDQQAHSSTSLCPPSNDVTADGSSSLSGVWVSPGITAHSQCPHPELSTIQVKGNSGSDWSLWKVFLACLLACAITTAIGVLVICLVNNRGSNSSVVIQLPTNSGGVVDRESGTASTTSQPTVTTTSTEPSTITTSKESTTTMVTTSSSTQPLTTAPLTTTSSRTRYITTATESMGTVAPP